MKTYKDVIEETVEYYSSHPRAFNGQGCDYRSANGAMCAVGRVLKPEVLDEVADHSGNVTDLFKDFNNSEIDDDGGIINFKEVIKEMIQEEYSELDNIEFWSDLQWLHDNNSNWKEIDEGEDNLLTEKGKDYKQVLIERYGN